MQRIRTEWKIKYVINFNWMTKLKQIKTFEPTHIKVFKKKNNYSVILLKEQGPKWKVEYMKIFNWRTQLKQNKSKYIINSNQNI